MLSFSALDHKSPLSFNFVCAAPRNESLLLLLLLCCAAAAALLLLPLLPPAAAAAAAAASAAAAAAVARLLVCSLAAAAAAAAATFLLCWFAAAADCLLLLRIFQPSLSGSCSGPDERLLFVKSRRRTILELHTLDREMAHNASVKSIRQTSVVLHASLPFEDVGLKAFHFAGTPEDILGVGQRDVIVDGALRH